MDDLSVRIRYYNILRDATRCSDELRSVPAGTTLRQLLRDIIASQYPEAGRLLLLANGHVSPYTRFFHNGEVVSESGLDEPLHDGDELRLYPAVAGG